MNGPDIQFTGVLLAGGGSNRFGQDKCLIKIEDKPLWQRNHNVLDTCCEEMLIAGDRPDLVAKNRSGYADTFPGSSLGGIHTGLSHSKTDWVTVLPCDLPFPSAALIRKLQAACTDSLDAVVPRTRLGLEPLVACYYKSALPEITNRLMAGKLKVFDLLDDLNVRYLGEEELPPGWRRSLCNINTQADLDKLRQPPPVITFIAKSGTGKTTLLEKLISQLSENGWTIGALKHDAHRFDIDHEGKDSWRLTRAGATVTAISSPDKTAIIEKHDSQPEIDQLLAPFLGKVDLVLTEGFKQSALPKIEVHRSDLGRPLLSRVTHHDPNLIGVASDSALDIDVPCFNINNIKPLATFIEEHFLS